MAAPPSRPVFSAKITLSPGLEAAQAAAAPADPPPITSMSHSSSCIFKAMTPFLPDYSPPFMLLSILWLPGREDNREKTGGAFRGYGVTQGTFALESAVNELAAKLNMDPVKLREKNMIRKGETSEIFNLTTIGAGDEPIPMDSCELKYCVEKGKEVI